MKALFQPKTSGIATVLLAALTLPSAWASDGIGAQAPSDLPENKTETEPPQLNVSGLPISGRLFSDIYLPIKNLDTAGYLQSSASVWIQGDPKLGENGYARFILASDAIDANNVILGGSTAGLHTFLREAYAGYAKNGWDVRLGRQILPWGKTDVFNPTDFLSAKDFTFFNPDPEVQRIGATSLWLTWTPAQGNSPFSFTVVATPVFPQTKLLIPPASVPSEVTVNTTPISPPQTVGNTETALKVAYNAPGWDASVSAFRGFTHTSQFAVTGTTLDPATGVPTSLTVGQVFYPVRALGADGSFTAGKWIFRGESAYEWTENNDGTNPPIELTHWDTVLGVERPLGNDFRIQPQLFYRVFPRFTPPNEATGPNPVAAQVNQSIAAANALLLAYQDKTLAGATLRLAYTKESEGIDADISFILYFTRGDYLVRPKFAYNWTDALKTTLGVDFYGGPTNTPLGALDVYNAVFIEAKYTF